MKHKQNIWVILFLIAGMIAYIFGGLAGIIQLIPNNIVVQGLPLGYLDELVAGLIALVLVIDLFR
jgi:predicted transglutaminase-like protease